MRGEGLWPGRNALRLTCLLCAALIATGCAAETDAPASVATERSESSAAVTPSGRPQARTREFIEAYESGVRQGLAESREASTAGKRSGTSGDAEFDERWHALSQLKVPDLDAYVRSGEADQWLDGRYRELGYVTRDLTSANALLFLSNWEAFTGTAPSLEQAGGVLRQVEVTATQQPLHESAEETETRRRVYDLMSATLMRESRRIRTAGNDAQVQHFAQTVRSDFQRLSNNDLAAFTLTGTGFQER